MTHPRLLITGINGLIGRLLRAGLAGDYDIHGLDRVGPFSARVLAADCADFGATTAVFQQLQPRDVIHLAANARVAAPWESVLADNIIGTRHVFEAARLAGVRRVVFASSNHVTGAYEGFAPDLHLHRQHEPPLITVQHPIRPDSDYGVSKAFGEALARYYAARWGIDFICLRLGAILRDDDPSGDPRSRKIWLSHRDLVQLVACSLAANVTFGIYYGISDNRGTFLDIANTRRELGYQPQDDGSRHGERP